MSVMILQTQWVSNGGSDSYAFVRARTKELRFRIIIATPKEHEAMNPQSSHGRNISG